MDTIINDQSYSDSFYPATRKINSNNLPFVARALLKVFEEKDNFFLIKIQDLNNYQGQANIYLANEAGISVSGVKYAKKILLAFGIIKQIRKADTANHKWNVYILSDLVRNTYKFLAGKFDARGGQKKSAGPGQNLSTNISKNKNIYKKTKNNFKNIMSKPIQYSKKKKKNNGFSVVSSPPPDKPKEIKPRSNVYWVFNAISKQLKAISSAQKISVNDSWIIARSIRSAITAIGVHQLARMEHPDCITKIINYFGYWSDMAQIHPDYFDDKVRKVIFQLFG